MVTRDDILGSMKADGSRVRLQPADVRGRFMNWRRAAFTALIAFYVAGPFIPVGGHPMIHLDVARRRFYFFGQTFNAQDFWLVLLLALVFVFGLLLVTAWRGRVWCGWACPQSVFLEGVYRPIERFIDGSREQRLKLDAAPWSPLKVFKRVSKFVVFLVVSAAIAHTATALFVSPRELWLMINEGPAEHLEAFLLTVGFTALLQFNFWWFREQFCVVLCPYGRLQSVLHDKDSVTVAYREARGEPRGKLVKLPTLQAPPRGDCVDCNRCVVVCPTGIDIRKGLQMECLACTACIDACDDVMDKVHRPRGLIGFASQRELATGARKTLRPRVVVYAGLFVIALVTLLVSLTLRTPFEANVVRARGAMPFVVDGERVTNAFEVHLFNKQPEEAEFSIAVRAPAGANVVVGTPVLHLGSLEDARIPVSVSVARFQANTEFTVEVTDLTSGSVRQLPMRFMGPTSAQRSSP
ncbi:MAG: cytochrome c oxidase accessory protein CcoG [Archangium gephyra]|uniref:Cytochrome c oxidase accessory protein CcoG n=1 Tax=Archangium gephyra TaxID=48 RepID=A0A2W5T0E2_9BACT|nr:MAG: cytochrome c oxidase accessory protein CcoG [Archangium gephyra]